MPVIARQSGSNVSNAPVPSTDAPVVALTFPAVLDAAEDASSRNQRLYFWLTGLNLVALVMGGLAAAVIGQTDKAHTTAAIVTTLAFLTAALARSLAWALRPERLWLDARSLAESTRSLVWRYMMRAAPFGERSPEADFDSGLRRLVNAMDDLSLHPDVVRGSQVTQAMRGLRDAGFEQRRAVYQKQRLEDQLNWYLHRSRQHEQRAQAFTLLTVLCETAGATGGLLQITNTFIHFDLLPVVAAAASALVAWERAKQDAALAKAYKQSAQELVEIEAELKNASTEDEWLTSVQKSEDALSQEHSLWRKTRV